MFDWLLVGVLALSAPSPSPQHTGQPAPAQIPDAAPAAAQILALPPELKTRVHAAVLAEGIPPPQRLDRLVGFVFSDAGLGMTYRADATHTVAQSYETRQANCLGFSLLFLALAREVGLQAYPQEISDTLAWYQQDGTVYRNGHVNVGVRFAGNRYILDVAGDAVIARRPPKRISEERLLAHYYNNLAIAQLERGDYAGAQRLMDSVLILDPDSAVRWSNAGVMYLRNGDAAAASRAYQRALTLDPRNPDALFNSVSLAQSHGDSQRADELRDRLVQVQKRDPFHLFLVALDYERAGNLPEAIDYFNRAIRLHRNEPRFHSALARAYLESGDTDRANDALTRAATAKDRARRDFPSETASIGSRMRGPDF